VVFNTLLLINNTGTNRFADIIALKSKSNEAYILDPTIKFENNVPVQAERVDEEKQIIYVPCISYFQDRCREHNRNYKFTVRGLLFGTRGIIYQLIADFFQSLGIEPKCLHILVDVKRFEKVCNLVHHHIYKNSSS
ncbi:hypothetical protein C0J52_18708, partial [Blattella germanica]